MNIGLFHGYELFGSGSNEYCRYLAKTFVQQNHTVHIICRERNPEELNFIGEAWIWNESGQYQKIEVNPTYIAKCTLHQIPAGPIYPVYVADKQRPGISKSFIKLTDAELLRFKQINTGVLHSIFSKVKIDVLHANHLVMQPSVAIDPCKIFHIPLIIFPHGSAIEYTVKNDTRFLIEARKALVACDGLICGNREVRDRITQMYPDIKESILAKTDIVGVGVDTTLFMPIAKDQRYNRVQQLIQSPLLAKPTGKNPSLLKELHAKLAAGNYQAVHQYHNAYANKGLDMDVVEKLQRIDFNKSVLLYVGALIAGKGLQSLLCALTLVFESHADAQLLIVGSGAYREVLEALIYALVQQDKPLLEYLTKNGFDLDKSDETGPWLDVQHFIHSKNERDRLFNQACHLEKQVSFLGHMSHEQLAYIYPCADMTVFPSVIPEAYPLVLMESLANGVLPLVSYFGGFKDAIDELEQFLPVDLVDQLKISSHPEKRITSMAKNISSLIDINRQQEFSEKLADIARNNYDWQHRAKALIQVYKKRISST